MERKKDGDEREDWKKVDDGGDTSDSENIQENIQKDGKKEGRKDVGRRVTHAHGQ